MKTLHTLLVGVLLACPLSLSAEDNGGSALAGRLNAQQQDGSSFIRLRMEIQQPAGSKQATLQLQLKQRRTATTMEVVYQILWPKERAGESVLLRKTEGQAATGAVFIPPGTLRTLDAGQMKGALFGSALTYADVVENFFAWSHQAIIGAERVGRVDCQILESKPGKSDRTVYAAVRTWVDTRRLVPLRIEKYLASGRVARRIDTTRVVTEDHRAMPANLSVSDPEKNSMTELDGANIKRGVAFDGSTFTPEGLKVTTPPRAGGD
jgi:hypothetical protein